MHHIDYNPMRHTLKQIALASALACLSVSAFASNYFFIQPKSQEMSKSSPVSVTLGSATLPSATVGTLYNTSGYDFSPQLSVSGDPNYSSGLATFAITSGNMPAGMALSSSGQLTGTPSAVSASTTLQVAATYKSITGTQSYNWVAVAGAAADPTWADVSMLMRFENNAQNLKTGEFNNAGLAFSGTSARFGNYGGAFTGGANSYLAMPTSTAIGPFAGTRKTIETWIRPTTLPGVGSRHSVIGAYEALAVDGRWYLSIVGKSATTYGIQFLHTTSTGSDVNYTSSATATVGNWSHIAVSVDATTPSSAKIYLSINGVTQVFTSNMQSQTVMHTPIYMGKAVYSQNNFIGDIDEFRVTKNQARYTTAYTVPVADFPGQ